MLKKIHIGAGLLTFVNLAIFGLVGFSAVVLPRTASPWQTRELPLQVDPGMTDRAIAERVCAELGLSLATPIQRGVIQHDGQNRLVLDFWHVNGRHRVTILRPEGTMRVEVSRSSIWKYLDTLHTTTATFRTGDRRMRLWAWYNEMALWSLLVMMATGFWMWLQRGVRTGRKKLRSLHLWTALFCTPFLITYIMGALAIAHRSWFSAGWLVRVHTHLFPGAGAVLVAILSAGVLILGITGIALWIQTHRIRGWGLALLLVGAGTPLTLIVGMRLG